MCSVRLQSQWWLLLVRTAGAENFPGVADDVGASEGVNGDSGAVVAPENGQSWTDAGGFDRDQICIVGESVS